MAGGSCHSRKRSWRAPLGFCPLQRPELRKSTDPGFPSPGLFPSRRFSRPQGLTPSEAARACSIPQPLMGFRLQSLPVGRDALAGQPVVPRVPPKAAATRRKRPAIGATRRLGTPKDARPSRGADERCDSSSPASVPVGRRSGPPSEQGPHGGANLFRTSFPPAAPGKPDVPAWPSRCPPEGELRSSRAGADRRSARPEGRWSSEAQSLDRTHAARAVACGSKRRAGRSKPRPALCSSPCDPLRTRRPTSGHDHIRRHTTRLLRRSGTSERHPQGEGASPFRSGR
jgi:hypothetical protein